MFALCPLCHWLTPMPGRIAGVLTIYMHCMQGVPGAPLRERCLAFLREPGADDDRPRRRPPGRWQIVGTAN